MHYVNQHSQNWRVESPPSNYNTQAIYKNVKSIAMGVRTYSEYASLEKLAHTFGFVLCKYYDYAWIDETCERKSL